MTELEPRRTPFDELPAAYGWFLRRMLFFVEGKGVVWAMLVEEDGSVLEENDWDLRRLTGSHARSAARTNGFSIDLDVRNAAVAAGWAPARLPDGRAFRPDIQDFMKCMIAYRCKQHIEPRSVRNEASIWRKFFSVTSKAPWELSTEDFNRFMELIEPHANALNAMSSLASAINENMLSENVPLALELRAKASTIIQSTLDERRDSNKLPDPRALYELVRIVFQERPIGHQDRIRFYVIRLLLFTGLRTNEAIYVPADCLQWETHVDVVTGKEADEVGGVSRTLRLRYFGLKREKGKPDLLVEDTQFVPEQFHRIVTEAVEGALAATAPLRTELNRRLRDSKRFEGTREVGRRFKASSGAELTVADMLFLVIAGGDGELPSCIPNDARIEVVAESTLYQQLSSRKDRKHTLFTRYGQGEHLDSMMVNPHSLRHLMNTEFFRLNIPDTIITQHFGRTTVVQSYEYDHRNLAERFSFVELPESANGIIASGSVQETVAKMVLTGFASDSHVAKSFKRIQAEHGDEAAFTYLAGASDGFHVTPYGLCTTSFAVNPCVKHLKCFHKCTRYMPSGLPEHRITLEQLRVKLSVMRDKAAAKPVNSIGRKNQIAHADELIAGVDAALRAQPGEAVFPDGKDYSVPPEDLFA
ncbi:hypothetical protein [Ralstonia pseudosolanacearum]|uniref:hypothetical protein n=1 Tax=Ralstonia pseudosolanacearum TaxID=1310165 RepID=UPI0039C6FC25